MFSLRGLVGVPLIAGVLVADAAQNAVIAPGSPPLVRVADLVGDWYNRCGETAVIEGVVERAEWGSYEIRASDGTGITVNLVDRASCQPSVSLLQSLASCHVCGESVWMAIVRDSRRFPR